MIKELEINEFDDYKMKILEDTPENRKKAAEAKEKAVLLAVQLNKKYGKTEKST